ncbi:MAG TPA: copper oxidase, partial [Saprospiraceae bacterium]|nr:copper oxidase [Saprospiraceae bacterium]
KMHWFMPFVGFDWRYRTLGHNVEEQNLFGQRNTKDNRTQFSVGVAYTLPMLIILQSEVYHDGNVRIQIKRDDIPISSRLRAAFMINSDKEYMLGLGYIVGKNFGFRTHFDSDMGFGVGLHLNY